MATYSCISCLGNRMDRGASWATVHGVTKSWTRLSPHAVDKGFPGSASGQEPACQWGRQKRCWFYLWVGKIPWSRKWQPTTVFLSGESPWTEEPSFFSPLTQLKWLSFTCTGNSAFGTPQTGRGLCAWGWGWSWGCWRKVLLSGWGACKALLVPTAATDILAQRNLQNLQRYWFIPLGNIWVFPVDSN